MNDTPKKAFSGRDNGRRRANGAGGAQTQNGKKNIVYDDAPRSLAQSMPSRTVLTRGGIDRMFLVLIIVLLCFGTVMIFSASFAYARSKYGDSLFFIKKQLLYLAIGLAAMLFCMYVLSYRTIKKMTWFIFVILWILLASVPVIGTTVRGAKRWIYIGPISFQPSEFMKFGLIVALAWYMARLETLDTDHFAKWKKIRYKYFYPLLIIGVVCATTIIEKHLSGTIILGLIGVAVIFIGGFSWKFLVACGAVGAVGIAAYIKFAGYATARWLSFIHPENYADGDAWQVLNGLYALGSGGLFGVGLGNSREKYLYLPDPQNDFIFAIIGEELGFVGTCAVVILFALLVWRGFIIAKNAPDTFSSLLAYGIVSQVAIQTILNIAVVTHLIPATGVSLPFFSCGGTSLIMLLAEMGVVLGISRYSYQKRPLAANTEVRI